MYRYSYNISYFGLCQHFILTGATAAEVAFRQSEFIVSSYAGDFLSKTCSRWADS